MMSFIPTFPLETLAQPKAPKETRANKRRPTIKKKKNYYNLKPEFEEPYDDSEGPPGNIVTRQC